MLYCSRSISYSTLGALLCSDSFNGIEREVNHYVRHRLLKCWLTTIWIITTCILMKEKGFFFNAKAIGVNSPFFLISSCNRIVSPVRSLFDQFTFWCRHLRLQIFIKINSKSFRQCSTCLSYYPQRTWLIKWKKVFKYSDKIILRKVYFVCLVLDNFLERNICRNP